VNKYSRVLLKMGGEFLVGDDSKFGIDPRAAQRLARLVAGSIRETGPAPIRRVNDPELLKGKTEVEEEGSPARATTVTRTVYGEDGNVIHDETWNTSYRGEYRIIRVGTKLPPKPPEKPKSKDEAPPAPPTPTTPDAEQAPATRP